MRRPSNPRPSGPRPSGPRPSSLLRRLPRTAFCVLCAFLLGAMALSLLARMAHVTAA